jgi:hypothetical protein
MRTLHRHVAKWWALHGEDQGHEVFFPQQHRAGEAGQTDFTHTQSLAMTLEGEAFAPLLCHFVLPYSNWEWACRCQSESLLALKKGVQEAVFRLGRVPGVALDGQFVRGDTPNLHRGAGISARIPRVDGALGDETPDHGDR